MTEDFWFISVLTVFAIGWAVIEIIDHNYRSKNK